MTCAGTTRAGGSGREGEEAEWGEESVAEDEFVIGEGSRGAWSLCGSFDASIFLFLSEFLKERMKTAKVGDLFFFPRHDQTSFDITNSHQLIFRRHICFYLQDNNLFFDKN
jgi:hypothetical protein